MTEKSGVLDSHHLGEVLKNSARRLGERGGLSAVTMLANRLIEYIGSVDADKYTYIWRSSIQEHSQDAHRDGNRFVLVDAVRDAALGATGKGAADAEAVVEILLQSPYPTLNRIGIYVSTEHYGWVGSTFWRQVQEKWFGDVSCWHEIFWFIKNCFEKFSVTERSTFLSIVDRYKGDWNDETRQQEWNETHKRDLLHPAYGLGDKDVDEKYQGLVKRWGSVREHPDFHSYVRTGWVGERSPITSDTLVGMSGPDMVAFLQNFKPDGRSFDSPTYRGLASSITAAVRASDDGFSERIRFFESLARPYQHGLIRGLKERWSDDKRDVDWVAVLGLLKKITESPLFISDLSEKKDGWEPSVHWVVSDISDLLKSAFGEDRHLPANLYTACFDILKNILVAISPARDERINDPVSDAINMPRGRCLEAIIHLALAMKRDEVHGKTELANSWVLMGPIFDSELAASEIGLNPDFASMCGLYCANFHYINSQWTEDNFDRLFSLKNEDAWRCAAEGFAYQAYMYDWFFNKLIEGGHLRKMVMTDGLSDHVSEKALQFLALAYLEEIVELKGDGLLAELVSMLHVSSLEQVSWFFWTFRGKKIPATRVSKILDFWLTVSEKMRKDKVSIPELQSSLSRLADFLEELTPTTVEALIDAAPHAQTKHNGHILVSNLARLVSKYPREVASVFRAAMSGFLPDYRQEDVIRCVIGLADGGELDEAERICNDYANNQSTLLKATYEEIRSRQRSAPA